MWHDMSTCVALGCGRGIGNVMAHLLQRIQSLMLPGEGMAHNMGRAWCLVMHNFRGAKVNEKVRKCTIKHLVLLCD